MKNNPTIEQSGNPFNSQALCEAELLKQLQLEIQHMVGDYRGLHVRTEFP